MKMDFWSLTITSNELAFRRQNSDKRFQDAVSKKFKACALDGLNLNIASNKKIGVCGRTGAGKSSLFSAFFRFVQGESGQILIDGIHISTIALSDVRRNIGIIPQEPVIFSHSIRFNLDPNLQQSDENLWHALECVQLAEEIRSFPNKLDAILSENGGNFSNGQIQLLCFARALLKPSKIILIDKATSNVDSDIAEGSVCGPCCHHYCTSNQNNYRLRQVVHERWKCFRI
jgi:ABC-type multidrug transport system fused ATPase/permease subunit